MKQNTFLTFEAAASSRKACFLINYSLKLGAKQLLRTQSQNKVP